ncbi:hypothetical protein [Nocardioides insulae]|uniref:hypothetical protein n=1 Tax=Nocardioides insulae TaxID=394734 RepID=UPI00048C9EB8|nr:hypothetical protein [Nocardioides insulae]
MRPRLLLLAGQTTLLGVMVAFLVVPASALFLAEYGAEALPYAYLTVAVAGIGVSAAMRRAQSRLTLARLAGSVLAAYVVVVALAWAGLALFDGLWATFPLLVLFPLIIPVGFVLIGSQAGRLLDVRQMKAHLPRVVAGFSVGFAVGGLAAALLVGPFGGPVHLLGIDVASGLCLLILVAETSRRFPTELRAAPAPPVAGPGPRSTARALVRSRLVLVVFGYQVLSAAATQLLDFLVWEQASVRYPDAADLARFQGLFGALINVVSIVFVVVFAGRLLTRWGVGFGLVANPLAVVLAVAAGTLIGYGSGTQVTAFFVIVCVQQILDIALTDGMTRTSINATYQALPATARLRAQTAVEGAGVPLALGLTGVFLLLQQALGLDVRVVELITLLVAATWVALGWWAYREYGAGLRELLGTPPWTPVQPWGMSPADPAPEAGHELRADLLTEATRVRRVLQVLDGLDGAAALQPLRSALRDEIDACAQRVTESLARAHGREPMVRAVAALASTVEHDRGIALEMIEVTCGRSARMVVALVDPTLDEDERRTRLGDPAPRRPDDLSDQIRELVADPEGWWAEPWLRVCALYAAPVVLRDAAAEIAGAWVDDPDPAVAETARWVTR